MISSISKAKCEKFGFFGLSSCNSIRELYIANEYYREQTFERLKYRNQYLVTINPWTNREFCCYRNITGKTTSHWSVVNTMPRLRFLLHGWVSIFTLFLYHFLSRMFFISFFYYITYFICITKRVKVRIKFYCIQQFYSCNNIVILSNI